MHRVRVELGLQAEGGVGLHGQPVLTQNAFVHRVEGVQLYARQVRPDLHGAAAVGVPCLAELAEALALDAQIVVKTAAKLDQVVIGKHILPQFLSSGEVQRPAQGGDDVPIGDQAVRDRGGLLGVELQPGGQDLLLVVSGEVEESVVGWIEGSDLVAGTRILQRECVILLQGIGHLQLQAAREPFFSIGALIGIGDGGLVPLLLNRCLPQQLVIAPRAAVQGVGPIVGRQVIGFAI